jgi:beta-lactamase class A
MNLLSLSRSVFLTFFCLVILISFQISGYAKESEHDPDKNIDPVLTEKLEELIQGFQGDVGLFVRDLTTGRMAAIRADDIYPTASMIKVPILVTLFNKIANGELDYTGEQVYADSMLYAGEDILGSFKAEEKIALSKLVMLMITMSDNTASLWCQKLAGTGVEINKFLAANGFEKTRMNSRTPDRKKDWEKYGWGQTSPREMAELLVMIREGKMINPAASEEMYRVLCNIYWNGEALSQFPPSVQAASKQGAVNQSRSEVVLVNGPSGDYVYCIITNNQKDESWKYDNEGFVLIREVSKQLWSYFEPESDWQPPADSKNGRNEFDEGAIGSIAQFQKNFTRRLSGYKSAKRQKQIRKKIPDQNLLRIG